MITIKRFLILVYILSTSLIFAQFEDEEPNYPPYVNQLGYNLNESKRFVCYGANEDLPFVIRNTRTKEIEYKGTILNYEGWFSDFNPISTDEYVIEVEGEDHGISVPFKIEEHLLERKSTKLGYDFFVDVRGFADLDKYNMSKVYSGGPSRDGGAFGLETIFEVLQYASNPAVFDNWKDELGEDKVADLIDLILWHAEFAYKYIDYNGSVKNRHGTLGYEGEPRMNYDYWNTLDHLAAVCAAYHSFLKPYLKEETYQKYRKACLEKWEAYDRHKVVRYWTYSRKWVDKGFQEFNEMGNAFGQSIFSNLFMYICEKNEQSPEADKFLKYAQDSAKDVITKWDFNNPRHMWWIRNAEHITPQSLGYFMLIAPGLTPEGTREKLEAWTYHMKQKTSNFWKYRVHSETEWAHPKTKELGGAPALGGSMFLISHLLNDDKLRNIGWAQVDFVFGVNPVGTHLSNKSKTRLSLGGYWEGVENGWPQSLEGGYGELGSVRGTLDGSPLDSQFPIATQIEFVEGKMNGQTFSNVAYATEGWNISNRGWMSTLTFSTLGSHTIKITDKTGKEINAVKPKTKIFIELKAALNVSDEKDKCWVDVYIDDKHQKLNLIETAANSGIFKGELKLPKASKNVTVSYGYLGFEKTAKVIVAD
ncbi:hypothetical protein [Flavivirga eckloniae]|uniref:Cellulase Ig-like domain-containing protein n=1 Tax=Flavivirga eckloniae TaxID=1803846 RepID=A0A2K9PRL4_9FLAO|nr:hypothetical protein [Flavivirga eckloniae]AUP79710.1 hypothetical protein C1H87_13735 [Flavivirga eckloniae]